MVRSLLFALAAAGVSSAHFVLNWPPTAGFIDDDEPNAPCGGATPTFNDSNPEVQVDRFAVSIFSSHPAGEWRFLATTDTEAPYNFTEIVPSVNSTGPGSFCLPGLYAPSDFAGKSGVLQVIDNSADGTLYQCAPVKFVSGSNNTVGAACTNATSFEATFASGTTTSNGSSTTESAASGSASSSSSTSGAALTTFDMRLGVVSTVVIGLLGFGLLL